MTFNDLKELLAKEDEVTLIELLDLKSVEMVDILESYIFDCQDKLRNYYGESPEDVGGKEVSD